MNRMEIASMTKVADAPQPSRAEARPPAHPPQQPAPPRGKGPRRLIVALIAVMVAAAGWFYAPPPDQVTSLVRGWFSPPDENLRVVGVVEANEVVVSSTLTARLVELRVNEGDHVEAGAVIATLDRAELEAARDRYLAAQRQLDAKLSQVRELVELESDRLQGRDAVAQAALAAAEQQREEALAELEQRHIEADRIKTLFDQGVVPKQELERSATNFRVAAAQYETRNSAVASAQAELTLARTRSRQVTVATSDVERTRAELRQANAQLAEITARLDQTILRAPITGVVATRVARQGEVIEAGRPIVTLMDPGDRWVRAAVDERASGRIALGQTLDVELSSGARLKGIVSQIAAEADFATRRDVNRVRRDVRSLAFKVAVPRDATGVYPGLTAYVYLQPAAAK
jgi:multidrug resistance efflux pump